jgi:zinc transport system substrate-binding protein
MIVMTKIPAAALLTMTTAVLAMGLSGCAAATSSATAPSDGRLPVSAAFYPLQFAAEQVGGSRVRVTSLTKPGGEPHDLELTPKDLAGLNSAKAVIYEGGFQPAVDDAVKHLGSTTRLDISGAAKLDLPAAQKEGHGEGETSAGQAPGHRQDPHFWLDPIRYAAVGEAIADRLAKVDPKHAQEYQSNAKAFTARLKALDRSYSTGLASCSIKDLVTGHAAFGYLAARYGLHQEAITISPDQEPSAAQMRVVTQDIREHGVTTVYSEVLVSPAIAETLARETGATVEVLDPIEGITSASNGTDYFQVMQSNLATLTKGQKCS